MDTIHVIPLGESYRGIRAPMDLSLCVNKYQHQAWRFPIGWDDTIGGLGFPLPIDPFPVVVNRVRKEKGGERERKGGGGGRVGKARARVEHQATAAVGYRAPARAARCSAPVAKA